MAIAQDAGGGNAPGCLTVDEETDLALLVRSCAFIDGLTFPRTSI